MNKKLIRKRLTAAGGPLFPWQLNTEWVNDWKFRTTPASRSRVISGKGVETDKQYTERRKKETTKRTWRSDVADIAHGVGEGVLALHPYTAIPYFGAKVGLDFLNGNVSWQTALNASVPLFHLSPRAVGLKEATNVALEDAANAGSKTARNWRVAREIKLGIKLNAKNGRIEVTEDYFNSPDKWYRITETPEKYGIMELGKNVTTHDAPLTLGTINGWRSSILNAKVTKGTEGFIKKPPRIELNVRRKNGQAHGNTSQAAKGKLWGGTTSGSRLFPEGIIEGQAPSMINYGIDRTNFVITPWELVPNGGRVGFHTGEMPMSNLGWFLKTNKGTYTYEPIIPEKRITYLPILLLEPSTSLAFFERKPAKISEAERAGVPKGERNVKQGYLLKDAIEEANKFAEKWGYDKLSQNATLLDIENLYNQHNTFFRGVTTEQLENTRNRVAKELGINPELLTNDLYLLYVSTHPWPGNDRIWVTPFSHYGKIYGNSDMIGGKGLLSAVMRPWKTTKDIKQWPKLSLWTLGFKEDVSNPVITPWVSNAPDAIRSLGALSEFLVKPPLIYRGLGKDFKGTFLLYLKYKDNQGKLGWIESLVGELPLEIVIEKQGGKMDILEFLKNGSGIHIKEKNKGKFTSYCGGKVTDECILKGKNSSNPAIRKRATFALNARHFKHEKGGLLKFEEGGKNGAPSTKFLSKLWFKKAGNTINNIGNNIGDFLKTDTGKSIMDIGLNILSGYTNYKKASNLLDSQIEQSKASLELAYLDTILLAILNRAIQQLLVKELWKEAYLNGETLDNYSDIVASHIGYDLYSNSLQNAELQKKQLQSLLDLQARNIKGNMMGNLFGSVVLSGLGVLGGILGNKSTTISTSKLSNNNTTYTSPTTGITASVDDWKKAIQG